MDLLTSLSAVFFHCLGLVGKYMCLKFITLSIIWTSWGGESERVHKSLLLSSALWQSWTKAFNLNFIAENGHKFVIEDF